MDKAYNSAERQPIIEEMEQLLSDLKRHVKYLREANKNLKKIEADMEKMEKYYMSEWIDDYENFSGDRSYEVLWQDPIYNEMQDVYVEKIKLLKQIVKTLN